MVVDRIGNTLNRAKQIRFASPKLYKDRVGDGDKNDFYRFQVGLRSRASFLLSGLQDNANIALLNQQGKQIKRSAKSGKARELIEQVLDPGWYYLRVYPGQGNGTTYKLRAALTAVSSGLPGGSGIEQSPNSNAPSADLKGDGFNIVGNPAVGGDLSVTFKIQNTGTIASTPAQVKFYLSKDNQIAPSNNQIAPYDELLGTYDLGSIAANSTTEQITRTLTLPGLYDRFFWNDKGDHYIGMVIDAGNAVQESNETDNSNLGQGIDLSSTQVDGIRRSFNIQFDYRFDQKGWFTPERRAVLETAADIWETIILDDFEDVPPTKQSVQSPEWRLETQSDGSQVLIGDSTEVTLDYTIDDLLIFVGSGQLGWPAGYGGPQPAFSSDPALSSRLYSRFQGADFEPAIGAITFNAGYNPGLSTALHEIGHVLGVGTSSAFGSLTVNTAFTGVSAKSVNGGNPIPLDPNGNHIKDSYEFGGTGETVMDPYGSLTEKLPTVLDLAILDDIGYTINYKAASRNASPLAAMVPFPTRSRAYMPQTDAVASNSPAPPALPYSCGCARCLMFSGNSGNSELTQYFASVG